MNDSTSPDIPNSGSHWSLLAVCLECGPARGRAIAWHLDSAGSANATAARAVTERLAQALERCGAGAAKPGQGDVRLRISCRCRGCALGIAGCGGWSQATARAPFKQPPSHTHATRWDLLAPATCRPIDMQAVPAAPQQRNGHDCGVHVLAAAEALWQVPPQEWPAEARLRRLPPASKTRQRWARSVQRLLEPA